MRLEAASVDTHTRKECVRPEGWVALRAFLSFAEGMRKVIKHNGMDDAKTLYN